MNFKQFIRHSKILPNFILDENFETVINLLTLFENLSVYEFDVLGGKIINLSRPELFQELIIKQKNKLSFR